MNYRKEIEDAIIYHIIYNNGFGYVVHFLNKDSFKMGLSGEVDGEQAAGKVFNCAANLYPHTQINIFTLSDVWDKLYADEAGCFPWSVYENKYFNINLEFLCLSIIDMNLKLIINDLLCKAHINNTWAYNDYELGVIKELSTYFMHSGIDTFEFIDYAIPYLKKMELPNEAEELENIYEQVNLKVKQLKKLSPLVNIIDNFKIPAALVPDDISKLCYKMLADIKDMLSTKQINSNYKNIYNSLNAQ
ncbi:MAG: hypothetical protein H7296_07400 [Bacteroidia bacterium]|nr:hypothetical protein [Bacteroidia bacterium]